MLSPASRSASGAIAEHQASSHAGRCVAGVTRANGALVHPRLDVPRIPVVTESRADRSGALLPRAVRVARAAHVVLALGAVETGSTRADPWWCPIHGVSAGGRLLHAGAAIQARHALAATYHGARRGERERCHQGSTVHPPVRCPAFPVLARRSTRVNGQLDAIFSAVSLHHQPELPRPHACTTLFATSVVVPM
jgi:hypothetical protein